MAKAADPKAVEWVFGIDDDDLPSRQALSVYPHHISKAGGGCCRAYNETVAGTDGEIIVCASDDVYPIQDWDRIIVERFGDVSKPLVLDVADGTGRDWLIPIQILTRAWFDKYGFVFPPGFKSMYGDVWLTETAYRQKAIVHARDLVFEHKHPFFGTAPMDDVYQHENAINRYKEGQDLLSDMLDPLPLSLCMICGNEESIILRCLESAKGAFDELCLVRAIGSQSPDRTVELAEEWCKANGKEFKTGEYLNEAQDWPHVDNFAAARNLSFSLATKYWQMWLDCDDTLDDLMCRRMREACKFTEHNGLFCNYELKPQGSPITRERIIKRGFGRWTKAVHETCAIKGTTKDCPQIVVYHGDPRHKVKTSSTRNYAILSQTLADAPRHYFYLHCEQWQLGMKEESAHAGKVALVALPDSFTEERYFIYLNLAQIEPEKAETYLLEAIKTQPHRREAYADLSQIALAQGRISDATSWFRAMDALPLPRPVPWTHRGMWYGWARNYLKVRILRAAGNKDLAQAEHDNFLTDPEYAEETADYEASKKAA